MPSIRLLCQIDSTLPQRLANVLYAAIVRKGNPAALRELAAVMEPLPIDPHWNRGLAMAWERFDDEETMKTWPRPNATGGRIWTTWPV